MELHAYQIQASWSHSCADCKERMEAQGRGGVLKYKNSLTYQEVKKESDEKFKNLKSLIECLFPGKGFLKAFYHCCGRVVNPYQNNAVYPSLKDFIRDSTNPDVNRYALYHNKPSRLTQDEVIKAFKEENDEKFRTSPLSNASFIAKVSTPESHCCSTMGYVIGKVCHVCQHKTASSINSSSLNVSTVSSSVNATSSFVLREDRHRPKLIAAQSNPNYALFTSEMLRFLVKEKNVHIDHVSHVFLYVKSFTHVPFLRKSLESREFFKSRKMKKCSSFMKNISNSLIGIMQKKSDKTCSRTRVVTSVDLRKFKNKELKVEVAGTLRDRTVYYLTTPYNPPTWRSYYFLQKNLFGSIHVLQFSKLRLLKIVKFIADNCLQSKLRLLRINTDSLIYASTENEPSFQDCVSPWRKTNFQKHWQEFIALSKDCPDSLGKIALEAWSGYKKFLMIAKNSRGYSLTKHDSINAEEIERTYKQVGIFRGNVDEEMISGSFINYPSCYNLSGEDHEMNDGNIVVELPQYDRCHMPNSLYDSTPYNYNSL